MPELETNILYYIRGRSHAGLSHASLARCKKQMTAGKADGRNGGIPVIDGKRRSMPHGVMTDGIHAAATAP